MNEARKLSREAMDRLSDALEAAGRPPTSEELSEAPKLENWLPVLEMTRPVLVGATSHHPILGKGKRIHTSAVMLFDQKAGYARTQSRWYRLGTPMRQGDPAWAANLEKNANYLREPVGDAEFFKAIHRELMLVSKALSMSSLDS